MPKARTKPNGPLAGLGRNEARDRLAADMAKFRKSGGKVQGMPMGQTGYKGGLNSSASYGRENEGEED